MLTRSHCAALSEGLSRPLTAAGAVLLTSQPNKAPSDGECRQPRSLADVAYEAKNYEQAYQYYSRLLEADPTNELAWAAKGLSAGWISTPSSQKLD